MTPKLPNVDPTILIAGAGPRGLSVLERLVTIGGTIESPPSGLTVEIVDPYEPGAGRIWRSDQSGALLMNTVIGQITIFGHDPAEPEEDAGPSFWEWLQEQTDPELLALEANGYAPRRDRCATRSSTSTSRPATAPARATASRCARAGHATPTWSS
jgi:uncharacterized NAD(P)/FAD-binding protein YdhS